MAPKGTSPNIHQFCNFILLAHIFYFPHHELQLWITQMCPFPVMGNVVPPLIGGIFSPPWTSIMVLPGLVRSLLWGTSSLFSLAKYIPHHEFQSWIHPAMSVPCYGERHPSSHWPNIFPQWTSIMDHQRLSVGRTRWTINKKYWMLSLQNRSLDFISYPLFVCSYYF